MIGCHFTWEETDGTEAFVYNWLPDPEIAVKAVVQISHGMAETAARYEKLALNLTDHGFIVYANDHRGHGRTAGEPHKAGIFPRDAFNHMVINMAGLTDYIRRMHPELPIFLLGHSMGSFLTQQYMYQFPDKISGVILTGSNGKKDPLLFAGIRIAALQAKLNGEHYRSKLLNGLIFGAYNKKFRPTRTAFDWLSRDTAEVDAYMADPFCGGVFTAGFYRDFLKGLEAIHRLENMNKIPQELQVLVLSGDRDPVGGMGKGVLELVRKYRELGMRNVSCKLYPGGRHEILNETNRDEVIRDIVTWLLARVDSHIQTISY